MQQVPSFYPDIIETLTSGVVIVDTTLPEMPIIYVNSAFEQLTGYPKDEILGRNCRFLQKDDRNQPEIALLRDAINNHKSITVTLRNYKKDGTLFWNELTLSPLFHPHTDQLQCYIGIQKDVTARILAEQRLRESEQRLHNILSSVPDVIFTLDLIQDTSTFLNKEGFLGYSLEELNAHGSLFHVVHPEDVEEVRSHQSALLIAEDDDVIQAEFRLKSKVGIWEWIQARAVVSARNADGSPREILTSLSIVTERELARQAEIEKELMRVELEKEREYGKLKSRFTSMASHEFRTPLTVMLSSINLIDYYLKKGLNSPFLSHVQKHVDKIKISGANMVQMLDDFLFLSKEDAGQIESHLESIDMRRLCREILDEFQMAMGSTNLLHVALNAKCTNFLGNAKLLRSIITNLVSNAIKYSPHGTPVYFDLICNETEMVIRVRDEGIGIPEADRKHLFQPFYRGNNVGSIAGTGLGLAIIQAGVQAHHGVIEYESQEGKGTVFTIRLPVLAKHSLAH